MRLGSDLPAISDATFPRAVVVVVAADRTPLIAFLNIFFASFIGCLRFLAPLTDSSRSNSEECEYKVTRTFTATFWSAILSARFVNMPITTSS